MLQPVSSAKECQIHEIWKFKLPIISSTNLNRDGGHLVWGKWPKINRLRPEVVTNTISKFEVNIMNQARKQDFEGVGSYQAKWTIFLS